MFLVEVAKLWYGDYSFIFHPFWKNRSIMKKGGNTVSEEMLGSSSKSLLTKLHLTTSEQIYDKALSNVCMSSHESCSFSSAPSVLKC